MSWINVAPPVVDVNGIEVVYPYLKGASSEDRVPDADEIFTQIRLAGASVALTRAQVSALAGALAGILDTERRTDIKRQAEQDAQAAHSGTTYDVQRHSLMGRIR